jgi:signal transduction histidine kinase
MEQQSFTSEFWEALGAVDILLLILAGFFGWKLRSIADRGQLSARDERLKLAREKQQDLAQKLAVVTTESLELQHQLALHDKGFSELAALQSSIRSTIAAIKRVNESSDVLVTTLTADEPSSYLHHVSQR